MKTGTIFAAGAVIFFMVLAGCGDQGRSGNEGLSDVKSTENPTAANSTVTADSGLPALSLEYRGKAIEGHRTESCQRPPGREERECTEISNWKDVDSFTEVPSGETLAIRHTSDTLPSRMYVYSVSEPGDVGGEFIMLYQGQDTFVLEEGSGSHKVRVTADWAEDEVQISYGFGLRIPGIAELTSECASTVVGGILGIVLESLEDPNRTAFEAVNHSGCRFNKQIAKVRLSLDGDSGRSYTETFNLEPPSLIVQFPVPEDVSSVREGGPLPPGEYSRRITVVTVDGDEMDMGLGDIGGIVKLVDESPEADAQIAFPQHEDQHRTYTAGLPEHIEGRIQLYRGCIYIRNGDIPVWPSNFTMRLEDGAVRILDESGNVVAAGDQEAVLAGHRVAATDPLGKEISRNLPLACPPGNFWIVGDEISELKESARRTIVPLQGSSLIFARQVPGIWSDELSISTEGEVVLEGDCLRVDDDQRHMIIWPPLFAPHMENGMIEIRDGDGRTVLRVGDRLEMTGFGSRLMRPHYADRCPGPYWTVGRITESP